jgi:pimeloyl-ACP methyl ester carboxylesterase
VETLEVTLHGHRQRVLVAGTGPALLLVHGIVGSLSTWAEVVERLAGAHTVVAPDLRGHGGSAGGPGDYSLGAHASGLRDLLDVLAIDRATVVGHSLGGGIAMQFGYQHPERTERLVLVSSGGLGREVGPLLRAASLPGSGVVLAATCRPRLVRAVVRGLGGLRRKVDTDELLRAWVSLGDREARSAFLATLRAVVGPGGQTVNATDKLYLTSDVPTLLVWGEHDPVIPVAHAQQAHAVLPRSRLEVFPAAGHFPHRSDPARFAAVLADFVAGTAPARHDPAVRRALIAAAPPP